MKAFSCLLLATAAMATDTGAHHTTMDYQYLRYVAHFNKEYRTLAEF